MGTLFICGTPIGNLEDISLRALRVLREADCIAAEDTRHTLKLLNFYEIKTPLTSYHEHNKHEKGPDLLRQLKQGRSIALVSDAGMPCISDPGVDLVRLCLSSGIPVVSVPGPSAVTTALAISGLDTKRFVFEGFLPRQNKKRRDIISELRFETRTIVIYEAPHHLKETLSDLAAVFGERPAALVRELTKTHEEIERASLEDLASRFIEKEPIGEYVIIVDACSNNIPDSHEITIEEHVALYLDKGMPEMDAIKHAARDRGIGKREVYNVIKKNPSR
jgi:16S rRNA (cytidine1402-2'-O)-methyltransferase